MKYVIMQSVFGDYWVGKTKLKLPDSARAFNDFEVAHDVMMDLCAQCENRDELELMEEDDIEDEITNKEMLKWLA